MNTKQMTRSLFSCLAALTVLGLLASCGGGGGGGSAETAPPAPAVASVYAGSLQAAGNRDGVGAMAQFRQPKGVAQDTAGTIYVADTGNHTIRKVTPQGAVTTLAGTAGQAGSADGTGTAARFSSPIGLALDATGNLYVADSGNHTVRKISPAGVVTTVVGTPGQAGSTDGPAAAARLDKPSKVAVDAAGTLYVLTPLAVRKVTTDGNVTTFAVGTERLAFSGIAIDSGGNILISRMDPFYVAGPPPGVRKFNAQGQMLPLGGSIAGELFIAYPMDIAVDAADNLLVANNGLYPTVPSSIIFRTIERFAPDGTRRVVAGVGGESRTVDGPVALARLRDPSALAVGPNGRIALVETLTSSVRVIDAQGTVSLLAGGDGAGDLNGERTAARFGDPRGLAAGPDGSLYLADVYAQIVRKISPSGVVTSLTQRDFQFPILVAVGPDGTVYENDAETRFGGGVWVVSAAGAKTGFYFLPGIVALGVEPQGNLLVANADRIVSVARDSSARTVASGLSGVRAVAGGASGRIYFATSETVGTVDSAGEVRVLAGATGEKGDQDGTGNAARFRSLSTLTIDAAGNLYAGDGTRIRKITADGIVTTIADLSLMDGFGDRFDLRGPLPKSILNFAWSSGALYATFQNAVIRIAPVN